MQLNTYLSPVWRIVVHLDKEELPAEYVWSSTNLVSELESIETKNLDDLDACRAAGRKWAETANGLAALVGSVVIPDEFNVLLNPRHAQYATLAWSNPRPFRFDPRLFTFRTSKG